MKQHLKLKLKHNVPAEEAPYWEDIIARKTGAATMLHPDIDAVFETYGLAIWVTTEYRPAGRQWDSSEVASGLNLIYRIILQQHPEFPPDLIRELSSLPIVEYARIGDIGQSDLPIPMPAQMSATADLRSREAIHLTEARQFTQGEPKITVAVLDTGIDLSHPELQEVLLPGYDFVNIIDGADKFIGDFLGYDESPDDEVGHGTHVAGIIAGQGLNMPEGVVPKCRILPVRVLGAMQQGSKRVGAGLIDNINSGIKWAIDQGADVINMSLGIRHTGGGLPHEEVVAYAQRKGVTIIAASGNDGHEQLYYPGALPYVMAVGAVDENGKIADFSTYGKQVDLAAPGTDIYSTYIGEKYAFSSGTSHAAPFVAGAVAMLKSYALQKRGMRLSDGQVKYILKHTADKIDTRFKDRKAGFGRLNLIDALKLLHHKLD